MFENKEKHPCYGKIKVAKYQGDSTFFGSNVKHHGGIIIEISRASYERSLHHDYVFSDETIAEVRLSPLQFAELITTAMNTDGVPCTVFRDQNGVVEIADFADNIQQFTDEYNEDIENQIKNIDDSIKLVDSFLSQKTVKKSDLKEVRCKLAKLQQDINSNMPYVRKCFSDHVKKSVLEAKTSVENFIESKIRSLGVESLKDLSTKKLK